MLRNYFLEKPWPLFLDRYSTLSNILIDQNRFLLQWIYLKYFLKLNKTNLIQLHPNSSIRVNNYCFAGYKLWCTHYFLIFQNCYLKNERSSYFGQFRLNDYPIINRPPIIYPNAVINSMSVWKIRVLKLRTDSSFKISSLWNTKRKIKR